MLTNLVFDSQSDGSRCPTSQEMVAGQEVQPTMCGDKARWLANPPGGRGIQRRPGTASGALQHRAGGDFGDAASAAGRGSGSEAPPGKGAESATEVASGRGAGEGPLPALAPSSPSGAPCRSFGAHGGGSVSGGASGVASSTACPWVVGPSLEAERTTQSRHSLRPVDTLQLPRPHKTAPPESAAHQAGIATPSPRPGSADRGPPAG